MKQAGTTGKGGLGYSRCCLRGGEGEVRGGSENRYGRHVGTLIFFLAALVFIPTYLTVDLELFIPDPICKKFLVRIKLFI